MYDVRQLTLRSHPRRNTQALGTITPQGHSGLNGMRFTSMVKRYEKDMRPPGYPGVEKLGFAELKSRRKLRMLAFSMALVANSTGAMLIR